VPENGSLALLGRNGVGKSTLLMTVMGYTQMRGGSVIWRGKDISKLPPHSRATAGIAWVAQEREIFPSLSVEENLTVAARGSEWDLAAIYKLFPRLSERSRNMGNQLSGGEQQMLAIARALMLRPRLMLLDEPSFGLAPLIVEEMFSILRKVNEEEDVAMLIVEQNAGVVLELADTAFVLETGDIVMSGTAAEIRDHETIRAAYLGY
jgi:branched-chain amino acid transport system ATP-binding protein